jgi:tRNA nucleotidyltransferase/poly(A) polymerase
MIHNFNKFALLLEAQQKLNMYIPEDIIELHNLFKRYGKKLYVVGGAVRDVLMEKQPKDYDLATDALPNETIKITKDYEHVLDGSEEHGVVKVKIPSEPSGIEIATFREDIGKGRRPDSVKFTTIEDDVKRRDLTINALFYDIDKREIVDLVGGLEDIENKKIRTVGKAIERFEEDALRKLRAIRFAGRTNSELDDDIKIALKADNTLNEVSAERIRKEFKTMIVSAQEPTYVLNLLNEYGFFEYIFPALNINTNFINTNNWIIQLATLLKNNDENSLRKILNKMTYTSKEVENVVFLISLKNLTPYNIMDYYRKKAKISVDEKDILEYTKFNNLDINASKAFIQYKPTTNAKDLMKQGVKGRDLGVAIKKIEAEKFKKLMEIQ